MRSRMAEVAEKCNREVIPLHRLFSKKTTTALGEYPCNDYLNDAISFLLDSQPVNRAAVQQILWAMVKSGGKVRTTLKPQLNKLGFSYLL